MVHRLKIACLGAAFLSVLSVARGQTPAPPEVEKWKWEQMDQGPFFASNVEFSRTNTTLKAVTLRVEMPSCANRVVRVAAIIA